MGHNFPTVKMAMLQVFDKITPDMRANRESLTRDEVIESVLDSERLENCSRPNPEELACFRKLPYDAQCKVAQTVFKHDHYV